MSDVSTSTPSPAGSIAPASLDGARVLLVGNPNVGKSALFNRLTGSYATVSNYPGTTVEIMTGHYKWAGGQTEVIDTPGMYSLIPVTAEEGITRRVIFEGDIRLLVHVIDAKNIERMLGLTLQLAELGVPMVLVLNMMDEARRLGIRIDAPQLSALLSLPVIPAVSITGEGLDMLRRHIQNPPPPPAVRVCYAPQLETAIGTIAGGLSDNRCISRRARALLLLQGDNLEREALIRDQSDGSAATLLREISRLRATLGHSPHYQATMAAKQQVEQLVAATVNFPAVYFAPLQKFLNWLCANPLTGTPILLAVLYLGFYKLVGQFGAGMLVDWIETHVFENNLIPWSTAIVNQYLPWPALRNLFCGEYGLITLGLRYAIAIILPIVGMFFAVFAILEDSGYLPRLALLTDRLFKKIGLNGRAIIPIVLGFGCDTMATIVTRTLETTRERIITTMLLALAIPCSAQLGVILALLSRYPRGLLLWMGVVAGVFVAAGGLAARLLPGKQPSFYVEMPPLRLPRPGNVLLKTYSRMVWYFQEVLPLFLLASVLLWLGELTNIFHLVLAAIRPAVGLLGLPGEAAPAFLFGFFRRDYGAAGLYDLAEAGLLNGNQLAVSAITMTLFLPCIAQFLVMGKERGWRLTFLISCGILCIAFAVGMLVNFGLRAWGMQL